MYVGKSCRFVLFFFY